MSIAKRVTESCEKLTQNDPEAAFIPASLAVDATAALEHPTKGVTARILQFIEDNMAAICFGGMPSVAARRIRMPGLFPRIKLDSDGRVGFESVLYHAVRCPLVHEASLENYVEFRPNVLLGSDSGRYQLCDLLPLGLIAAVVCSPANRNLQFTQEYEVVFPSSFVTFADLPTNWPIMPSESTPEFATGIRRVT